MTVELRARSPLDGWAVRFESLPASVRLTESPCTGQVNLRLAATDAAAVEPVLGMPLPLEPCTSTSGAGLSALWLGPDEWLILTAAHAGSDLTERLRSAVGAGGAVTDVSAQRTVLRLSGAHAAEVLAKGCSIDLRPRVSPRGTCVQTLLAQAGLILAVEDDTASNFLLVVRASFAEYVAAWLVDASIDLA